MAPPKRIGRPVGRLRAARRASVGLLAAVAGLAMFGMVGLSVDGARTMFIRERLISALDSAALAGARTMNSTTVQNGMPQWQNDALAYYDLNFPSGYFGTTADADPGVSVSNDGTQITVSQTVKLPLMFGGFIGRTAPVSISHTSVAFAGKVELSLVMDGSNFSAQNTTYGTIGLKYVQNDATALVSSLTSVGSSIRIAVVPFSKIVNVGAQYINASWLDSKASYIYQPNYYNAYTSPRQKFQDIFMDSSGNNYQMDRWTLFNNIKIGGASPPNSPWAGCVEMRPAVYNSTTGQTIRYDVNDYPVTSDPASKFIPYFAPSETDVQVQLVDYPGGTHMYSSYNNIYLQDAPNDNSSYPVNPQNSFSVNFFNNKFQQGDYRKYTSPVTSVPDWGQVHTVASSYLTRTDNYETMGPNYGCIAYGFDANSTGSSVPKVFPAVTRLTTDVSTLTSAISSTVAVPSSGNLALGTFWGWEMISPNSVFNDNQASYSDPDYKKAIVIISNGCNLAYNGLFQGYDELYFEGSTSNNCSARSEYSKLLRLESYKDRFGAMHDPVNVFNYDFGTYQPMGYIWQNRYPFRPGSSDTYHWGEQDPQAALDDMFGTICTNMKAEGIMIFTIGTGGSLQNNASLQSCATDADHFYAMPDANQLNRIFQQIASQLTTPRLIMK